MNYPSQEIKVQELINNKRQIFHQQIRKQNNQQIFQKRRFPNQVGDKQNTQKNIVEIVINDIKQNKFNDSHIKELDDYFSLSKMKDENSNQIDNFSILADQILNYLNQEQKDINNSNIAQLLYILAIISSIETPQYIQQIYIKGGIDILISLMSTKDTDQLKFILCIIGNICGEEEKQYKDDLKNQNLVQKCLNIIQLQLDIGSDIVSNSVWILANLFYDDILENQLDYSIQGLPIIINLLINNTNKTTIFDIIQLIDYMINQQEEGEYQDYISKRVKTILSCDIITVCQKVIRQNPNISIIFPCLRILSIVVLRYKQCEDTQFESLMSLVHYTLKNNNQSSIIVYSVMLLESIVARDNDFFNRLIQFNLVEKLLIILVKDKTNKIQTQILNLILKMINSDNSQLIIQQLVDIGILKILDKLMTVETQADIIYANLQIILIIVNTAVTTSNQANNGDYINVIETSDIQNNLEQLQTHPDVIISQLSSLILDFLDGSSEIPYKNLMNLFSKQQEQEEEKFEN